MCVWRAGDSGLKMLKEETCPVHSRDMLALFCVHAAWIGEEQEGDAFYAQASGLSYGLSTAFTGSKLCGPFCWCAYKCATLSRTAFLAHLLLLLVLNPINVFSPFLFMFKQNFCLDFNNQGSIK